MNIQDLINQELSKNNVSVEIHLSKAALGDLMSFGKGDQTFIIALIIKRAKNGPLIKPEGLGESLSGELQYFCKIKNKSRNFRIIYLPKKGNILIFMGVIAIGPRDKKEVYRMATSRVNTFFEEISNII